MKIAPRFPISTFAPPPDAGAKAHHHAKHSTTLTIETMNDDWASKGTNLPKAKADVVMMQEAKNTKVRDAKPKGYGVHWNGQREDQAGTAVLWKRDEMKEKASGYKLGVDHVHAKMLNRWINWVDVNVNGAKVRMISVHRPPKRFSYLWPAFDRNVAAFIKHTKIPVVVGMDSNEAGGPHALARATGLKWHGIGNSIDGFLASPGIKFEHLRALAKGTSDHHPVVAKIKLHTPKGA